MPVKSPRKRGRPAVAANKKLSKQLGLKFTSKELAIVKQCAKSAKMRPTQWARTMLLSSSSQPVPSATQKLLSTLKAQQTKNSTPADIDKAWSSFLDFYRCCESLPWTNKHADKDEKRLHEERQADLLNAFSMISKAVRQLALNKKDAVTTGCLVDSCMQTCHLLTQQCLLEVVTQLASDYSYFPSLRYRQPMLNRKSDEFLKKINLGSRVKGARPEAKWTDDSFFHVTQPIVDHVETLVRQRRKKKLRVPRHSGTGSGQTTTSLTNDDVRTLRILVAFADSVKKGQTSPKSVKDAVWKVINEVIIGSKSTRLNKQNSYLGMDIYWEYYFADKKLQEAVQSTSGSDLAREKAEIRKRIKEKFFAIYDR